MPPTEIHPTEELYQNLLKLQELEFGDISDSKTEAKIAALRRKVPPPILQHYDRLTARGKKGVAFVRHQVCTGCYMRVPIGAINTLMQANDLQMCETCGRYLYLPEEARAEFLAAAELARAAAKKRKAVHKDLAPVA